jgi:hypothetical protein
MGLLLPPNLNLSFSGICKVRNIKSSSFNAKGLRVIIVIIQVGAMKIYVAAVEALREKGKTG